MGGSPKLSFYGVCMRTHIDQWFLSSTQLVQLGCFLFFPLPPLFFKKKKKTDRLKFPFPFPSLLHFFFLPISYPPVCTTNQKMERRINVVAVVS